MGCQSTIIHTHDAKTIATELALYDFVFSSDMQLQQIYQLQHTHWYIPVL